MKILLFILFIFPIAIFGQCPAITGIMVNSCGGNTSEGLDEFFTFRNGPNPLDLNTWVVTFPSGAGINYCNSGCGANNWQIPNVNTANNVNNLTAGCPGLIVEPPGGIIPPFAWVIAFCGATPTFSYNFCGSCNVGPIYAVFTNSLSTIGKFSNTAPRTLIINFGGGCIDSAYYAPANFAPANTDGNYAMYDVYTGMTSYITQSCPGCIALPVRLNSFSGLARKNEIQLDWSFQPESELPVFLSLNKSTDGVNFSPIAEFKPAQNAQYNFKFIDRDSKQNILYYKLIYHLEDTREIHSTPIKIYSESESLNTRPELKLYPNPASAYIQIEYSIPNSAVSTESQIRLTDLSGRILKQNTQAQQNLNGTYYWDLSEYPTGLYIIQFIAKGEIISEKFSLIQGR